MALSVDFKITKVVIIMVTKRHCIPVAQINGLSGMMYIQIDIETIHAFTSEKNVLTQP